MNGDPWLFSPDGLSTYRYRSLVEQQPLSNCRSSTSPDRRSPWIFDSLNDSHLCIDRGRNLTLLFCLRLLLRRFRRKKLFKNEHFKLSISVVFPRHEIEIDGFVDERRYAITSVTTAEYFQFDPSQRLFRWRELFHKHRSVILERSRSILLQSTSRSRFTMLRALSN